VDGITPASIRPLAQVREQLVQMWKARERGKRLEETGRRIVAAINSGRAFADVVSAEGGRIIIRSQAADRAAPSRTWPQLFAVREGEGVMAVNPTATVLLVGKVEEVHRADPAKETAAVEQLRQRFQSGEDGLTASLGEAIVQAAQDAAKVQRNPRLLE